MTWVNSTGRKWAWKGKVMPLYIYHINSLMSVHFNQVDTLWELTCVMAALFFFGSLMVAIWTLSRWWFRVPKRAFIMMGRCTPTCFLLSSPKVSAWLTKCTTIFACLFYLFSAGYLYCNETHANTTLFVSAVNGTQQRVMSEGRTFDC